MKNNNIQYLKCFSYKRKRKIYRIRKQKFQLFITFCLQTHLMIYIRLFKKEIVFNINYPIKNEGWKLYIHLFTLFHLATLLFTSNIFKVMFACRLDRSNWGKVQRPVYAKN